MVAAVAAGAVHTVAMRRNGTLWGWGANWSGQLGDGTTTDRAEPVRIRSGSDWRVAAPGEAHTVALRTDGTLWAWGLNNHGQLGQRWTVPRRLKPEVVKRFRDLWNWDLGRRLGRGRRRRPRLRGTQDRRHPVGLGQQ